MSGHDILHEAVKLHSIGERLNTLAEQNRSVAEALTVLAKAVSNSATLLEVVVTLKMESENDVEKSSN
ncbi:MAG TPA: hypothetical protein VI320_20680 [Terracidiphilus sp.]|jgi:hypothetical protein